MAGSRKIGALGVEFVVVVAGVLAAFAVEEWRDRRDETRLAAFYLESLESDLAQDSAAFADGALYAARQSESAAYLDSILAGTLPVDSTRFDTALGTLGGTAQPEFGRGAYRDLVSSGNLRLLRDPVVRRAVTSYYDELDLAADVLADPNRAFVDGLPRSFLMGGYSEEVSWAMLGPIVRPGEANSVRSRIEPGRLLDAMRRDEAATREWLRRYQFERAVQSGYVWMYLYTTCRTLGVLRGEDPSDADYISRCTEITSTP